MKEIILNILEESLDVKGKAVRNSAELIQQAAEAMAKCLKEGGKILIFGNGGSAADAQHIAAEFVNRFMIEREPLAAVALTTDTSVITSVGNDYSFDEIFLKQVKAIGSSGDIAWGISTSGGSVNVVKGLAAAKDCGMFTIGMTGKGGEVAGHADILLTVESSVTARIQEVHITLAHILCELVERILFPEHF